jgi:hypothetical protein
VSLATFSLSDPSIAQILLKEAGKKAPPKRTATAMADQKLLPEPR